MTRLHMPSRARVIEAARAPAWGLLDQAVYSGTNFLAVVVVARALGAEAFGAFALALSVWTALWVLARSAIAEPFVIRAARLPDAEWRVDAAHAAGALTVTGTATALGVALVALLLDGPLGSTLRVLAPFVPVLMLQDFWRVAAFSRDSGRLAFMNDLVWAMIQVTAFLLLWTLDAFAAPTAMAAWASGGLAGMLVGFRQFGLVPEASWETVRWARGALTLGGWFGASRIVQTVGTHATFMLLGVVGSLSQVGGLRAVYLLFGPLMTAFRGVHLAALADLSLQESHRPITFYHSLLYGIAMIYAIAMIILSSTFMPRLLGRSFIVFQDLALPVAATHVTGAVVIGMTLVLQVRQNGRGLFVLELFDAAMRLILGTVFYAFCGTSGFAWSIFSAMVLKVILSGALIRSFRSET